MVPSLERLMWEEGGASVVEYSVLIALVIAGCIVIIQVLGSQIQNSFERVIELWTVAGG